MSEPDEIPMPKVTSFCKRCPAYQEDVDSGYVVVSPTGMAHDGADYGMTRCGIDATGDKWWWPL